MTETAVNQAWDEREYVGDRVECGITLRDFSQTEFDWHLRMGDPDITEIIQPAIVRFNKINSGPRLFIEGASGAHTQSLTKRHINPYKDVRASSQDLPDDVDIRCLIRASYFLGTTDSLSKNDLKKCLRHHVKCLGADRGRKVILKGFTADNLMIEMEDFLDVCRELQDENLNIAVELADSYTAAKEFDDDTYPRDIENYARLAKEHDVHPETFSLKDMIGGLKGSDAENWENAEYLTNQCLDSIEKVYGLTAKEHINFAVHCHDTGFAVEANVAAAAAALKRGYRIKIDTMPDGGGFANTLAVINGIEAHGYNLGVSDQHKTELRIMAKAEKKIKDRYKAVQRDQHLMPDAEAREGNYPGGGILTSVQNSIRPAAEALGEDYNSFRPKFTKWKRQLWKKLGLPNAVTPGEKNLSYLTGEVMKNLAFKRPMFKGVNPSVLKYFRSKKSKETNPHVFSALCAEYLSQKLPDMLPGNENAHIRDAIISNPADKENARKVLDEAGITGAQLEDLIEEVGHTTRKSSYGQPDRWEIARTKILTWEGADQLSDMEIDDYVVAALAWGMGSGLQVNPHIKKIFEIDRGREERAMPDPDGMTTEEWEDLTAPTTQNKKTANATKTPVVTLSPNGMLDSDWQSPDILKGRTSEELAADAIKDLENNPVKAHKVLGDGKYAVLPEVTEKKRPPALKLVA